MNCSLLSLDSAEAFLSLEKSFELLDLLWKSVVFIADNLLEVLEIEEVFDKTFLNYNHRCLS